MKLLYVMIALKKKRVKKMTTIKVYKFGVEQYIIDKKDEMMYCFFEDREYAVPFPIINDINKIFKNKNRLHKPLYLLFYNDWKNGNLKNWKYEEVEYTEELKIKLDDLKKAI
jgi:hypothetical protein